jgi:single-strand DNA-binding protein
MNKVILLGRLTRDPEVRYSQSDNSTATARFSLAVNRKFKNAEGNYDADFINCVAFGKIAEFIEKYFNKGDMIALTGRIQTGSYTNKDGVKVYTTDVVVEEVEFTGGKSSNADAHQNNTSNNNGFANIPDGSDEEMPF